ncbi:MAG TPA: FAD-dependent oxidoreductase [Pyrinomonadaceae bacterium]|jgi:sulfide:quinone oxidoreductase|nr:FAD-dependent oxidoreductase [Pyrinomonadaceae bacterium]
MAKVLILGGGFGGVVAAERLARLLSDEHQITLVSRSRNFVFYPTLVKLAFGKCDKDDVLFDLRHTILSRRVNFVEAEVAHVDPFERKVRIAHGEVEGTLPYDYLVFALGRRLATERITGFYEHAHHLLNVDKAIKFGKAVAEFEKGRAVFGECPGARLPVPVYESAFALAAQLDAKGRREQARITVVTSQTLESQLGDAAAAKALRKSLDDHQIELVTNFPITALTQSSARTNNGAIDFDLLMLVPPFRGSSAASYMAVTDDEGYVEVNLNMRVVGHDRIYAAGDCVAFTGPKMGHMAVRQGEVAATNLAAEIEGREPAALYAHEMRFVIDEIGGGNGLYVHKDMSGEEPATVRQGRFWSWAKQVQKKYWEVKHS